MNRNRITKQQNESAYHLHLKTGSITKGTKVEFFFFLLKNPRSRLFGSLFLKSSFKKKKKRVRKRDFFYFYKGGFFISARWRCRLWPEATAPEQVWWCGRPEKTIGTPPDFLLRPKVLRERGRENFGLRVRE